MGTGPQRLREDRVLGESLDPSGQAGRTALRLIKLVEASLYSEKEESPAEKEDLGE